MSPLKDKKIVLGVSGGIAAYKACEILRRLMDQGAEVHVVLTPAAQKFITPLSFQALSGRAVHTDLFSLTEESEMGHIQLADQADLILIAPTTADLIGRVRAGLAGDLLCTILLASKAPVLFVPSMNVNMWEQAIVQENIQALSQRGYHFIEPETGYLACGWVGKGRLADVEQILAKTNELLLTNSNLKKKSLRDKRILINAGPTREYLDPVRFISNPSSGKMGFALATAAQARGAKVTLVTGPVNLATPKDIERINVTSANEMLLACEKYFSKSHIFIATAAVGDYRPEQTSNHKIKKQDQSLNLTLTPNPDILQRLSTNKKNGQIVVGFAAETENLIQNAEAKRKKKNLDLIAVNDVSKKDIGFGSDQNQITLIDANGKKTPLPILSKQEAANKVLDRVEELLKS